MRLKHLYLLLLLVLCLGSCASWNGWHDAESVKQHLLSAPKKDKIYLSQCGLHDPRMYPTESKYYKVTKEITYIYAFDVYDAIGTYWGLAYKTRNRNNIIKIVKEQWKESHSIPSLSWHLENPYCKDNSNMYIGSRYCANKSNPGYPKEHKFVVHEILNNTGSKCGIGRYIPSLKESERASSPKAYVNPRAWFEDMCKEVADIINELTDEEGRPIPFLFRLWHECEDDWQWWGSPYVTESDYKEFFILTQQLIKKYAPKAEIVWVYGPDSHWKDETQFMSRYPGDDCIDIIGYDDYQLSEPELLSKEIEKARIVTKVAKKHNKIAALMETHNNGAPNSEEFYKVSLIPYLRDKQVNFSLIQIWDDHKFETQGEIEDRLLLLNQKMIIKKR